MRHFGWFGVAAFALAACVSTPGQQAVQETSLEASAAPVVLHDTSPPSLPPWPSPTPRPSGVSSGGPVTGTVLSVTPVGKNPSGIAFDALGNAWVTNFGSNTVSKLSSAGKLIANFKVALGPEKVALEPQKVALGPKKVIVAPDGNIWVADYSAGAVTEISRGGQVLRQVSVGAQPDGIAADRLGHIWVANSGAGTVSKLGTDGQSLGTFKVGLIDQSMPIDLLVDASGMVWVACAQGGVFELSQAGTMLAVNDLGKRAPSAITHDAAGNMWVTFAYSDADDMVFELDSSGRKFGQQTYVVVNQGIVGPGQFDSQGNFWSVNTPYAVSPSGGAIATPSPATDTVSKLSTQGQVLGWYPSGDAWTLGVDRQDVVWVLNYAAGTVTRLAP